MSLMESGEDIRAIMARSKEARGRLNALRIKAVPPRPETVLEQESPAVAPPAHPGFTWAEPPEPVIKVLWGKQELTGRYDVRDTDLLPISKIKEVVCRGLRVSPIDLISHRRTMNITLPRQIAMLLAYEFTGRSLVVIGREFNGRDHTTILHAVRVIRAKMESDAKLLETVERLRALLRTEEARHAETITMFRQRYMVVA